MFSGSIVAIITPMSADGGVDYQALEKLVEFHVVNKTDAIVAVGTTGESSTLDFKEHREVVRQTIAFAKGRLPVIAGTGSNSTLEAIKLTNWAAEDGAQGALIVVPYYNKPPQEGLYQHYKLIAESVDLPQILYNVPSRCACDLLPETVERLCEFDNIVAIKEASTLERVQDLVARVGTKISVLTGEDAIAAECVLQGARGVISVTANVAPKQMHTMIHAALKGDRTTAMAINESIASLHKALFLEANPIPVKWALAQMQMAQLGIRLPLVPLSDSYHAQVRLALENAGILSS
ncbi:dihydrodipicolinate synthase [Gammaproteobacteria bacterium]|nr:dihydrodipicolinate synthase [Gammaproteobacteria bacterium]